MPKLRALTREEQRAGRAEIFRRADRGELRLPGGIRDMRKALGLSQAQFGALFGMSRFGVIKMEDGDVTLERLNLIARTFGFEVAFVPKRPEDWIGSTPG